MTSLLVKVIGKSITRDPKIVIHDNSCIILYIHFQTSTLEWISNFTTHFMLVVIIYPRWGRVSKVSSVVSFGIQRLAELQPSSAFIKPDQRNPWIKDQLGNAQLSTIFHLQLPNFVPCGRDKPSHMTQNLVTVGAKL